MHYYKTIKEMIEERKKTRFTKDYRASATDAETLGSIISTFFDYDGLLILEACSSALEDSNFHAENKTILKMIEKLENT